MENNENKKPSAENAGEKKPNHKRHHHKGNHHHKPKNTEAASELTKTAGAPAGDSAPKAEAQNNQQNRNNNNNNKNKNKKPQGQPKARPEAEAKAEAMMLGVKTQYVDDVVTLALAKMTEDSDLKTIIGEFKTKYPVWFGESEEDDDKGKGKDTKGKTGQKGTGSSVKTSKEDKKADEKGLGARLAAQRRGTGKKSSYWGNNK